VAAAHGLPSRYLHYSASVCVRSERTLHETQINRVDEGLPITETESKRKLSLILSVSEEEWRGELPL